MQNSYRPLKRKFGAFVIGVSLFELVGCASPYQEKLNLTAYRIDCAHAEEQKVFLESLRDARRSEKWKADLELKFNPAVKDRDYKATLANGSSETEINELLGDLQKCAWNQNIRKQKQKTQ